VGITGQHGVTAVEQELAARTGQGLGGAARTLGQNSLSGAITNLTGSFGELILSMDNIEQSAGLQRFRGMLVGVANILNGSSAAGRQFQSTLRALIDNGFGALGSLVDPAMFERGFSAMLGGLRSMLPYVRAFVAGFRQGFAGALPAVATMFRTIFGMVSGGGGQGTLAFVQRLGQGLGTIASIATVVAGALGAIVTVLTTLTTAIVAFAAQMFAVVSNSVQAFTTLGGQIVDGLIQGLRGAWGRLTGELSALAASLPGPVRDALGIRSPSRVFAELGRQLPAGMAVGIEGGTDRVRSAVNDMVAVPSVAGAGGLRGRSGPLVGELHIHVGEGGEDLAETVRGGVLSALADLFDEAAAMEGA
jgi:phage-related protein